MLARVLSMTSVIAQQSFEHGGPRMRGQVFEVSSGHARQLLERGLVRLRETPSAPRGGSTFVVIASGPSLTAQDCERVRQWREHGGGQVIVINTSYRLAPWADFLYACDAEWWDKNIAAVRQEAAAQLLTPSAVAAKRHGLRSIKSRRADGLGLEVVHQGGNSGYQAVNLAFLWGAKRILLLGFDMQHTGGASHWHGDHPWKKGVKPPVRNWVPRFARLAEDLAREGVEVVNCTRETALQCFVRQPLETALGSDR